MIEEQLLDEGVLAAAVDGYIKPLSLQLQVSQQRIHQLIASDPFAKHMRLHRALVPVAPERAEQIAVYFNSVHDGLMMKRALPSVEKILSDVARTSGMSLATALSPAEVDEKLSEAFKAQRALNDYIQILMQQFRASASENYVTTNNNGGHHR
ncbi:MAG: hypothetical protein ICV60_05680 [Pyrinomonadaceae bacterium]|nr:hypothetical protein [Pyrinomonadaceae bacterium]